MKEIELPRVKSDTGLKDALEIMRDHSRSGLITEKDNEPVVITAKELLQYVRARQSWDGDLRDIQPESLTIMAPASTLESLDEPTTQQALQAAFSIRGASQAVISLTDSLGHAVAVNKVRAEALAFAVVVCTCIKDETHVWLPDELVNANCGIDGERVKCK